jgi:hypothetical protein
MAARALLLVVLLVAACGGGSTPTPAPTLGGLGGSTAPGSTSAPATPVATNPGSDVKPFRSSGGTQLRVVNLYNDASGKPSSIDIYGDFNAQAGSLLKTVPYATATDWFDPGVLDDQGDAEWSFYPTGKTTDDDQIGNQSETLDGTERITLVIAAGENKGSTGTQLARWKAMYENGKTFPLPTAPTSADAVLMTDGIGLMAFPGTTETFMYLGVDGKCLPSVDSGVDGGGQPTGPSSQQSYIFPAGSHAVSLYLGQTDCTGKAAYPDVTVNLKAGQREFLFFYSEDGKTLKTLQLPVEG